MDRNWRMQQLTSIFESGNMIAEISISEVDNTNEERHRTAHKYFTYYHRVFKIEDVKSRVLTASFEDSDGTTITQKFDDHGHQKMRTGTNKYGRRGARLISDNDVKDEHGNLETPAETSVKHAAFQKAQIKLLADRAAAQGLESGVTELAAKGYPEIALRLQKASHSFMVSADKEQARIAQCLAETYPIEARTMALYNDYAGAHWLLKRVVDNMGGQSEREAAEIVARAEKDLITTILRDRSGHRFDNSHDGITREAHTHALQSILMITKPDEYRFI